MSIVARPEWEAAFYAYRAAQARVNNAAAYLTLRRWTEQVGALRPGLPGGFVNDTAQFVIASRRMSRRLAQAWFQYARALDTGYQLGALEDDALGGTLNRLRQNFLDRLQDASQLGFEESADANEEVRSFERALLDAGYDSSGTENRRSNAIARRYLDERIQEFLDAWEDDERLDVEDFAWRTDSDPDQVREWISERLRQVAEAESRRRREEIRARERDGEEVSDDEVEDEHEKAGQVVAGEVHEATADAARKLKEWAFFRDARVRAVARGTSATPCAFCAMLASRGFVYRSVQSAVLTRNSAENPEAYTWANGFRKIHPNCNCYPIIRWKNVSDVDDPELTKEFKQIWKDSGGNLKEFRKNMYQRNKKLIQQA